MNYYLIMITFLALSFSPSRALSESKLLEGVKGNSEEAKEMCEMFRLANQKGVLALSKESISQVAKNKNLSSIDAEILSTYVLGLYCPDIR